jgi:hypothetical protein
LTETTLPTTTQLVVDMEHAVRGEPPATEGRVTALVLELLKSNVQQWDLEDTTRAVGATDEIVAGAKRAIDRLNLARHRLLEQVDLAIDNLLDQSPTAPLSTESPAMALDRLSVLVIRIARTAAVASTDGPDTYADRIPILHGQLAALSTALDALLADVGHGTRRFLRYEHFKLYVPLPPSSIPG